MKTARETTTSIIEGLLREHQLLSMKDIVEKVRSRDEGRTVHDAMGSLHRKYRALGVLDVDGVQYFYLTPETDTRLRKVGERRPETKSRRRRQRRQEDRA